MVNIAIPSPQIPRDSVVEMDVDEAAMLDEETKTDMELDMEMVTVMDEKLDVGTVEVRDPDGMLSFKISILLRECRECCPT